MTLCRHSNLLERRNAIPRPGAEFAIDAFRSGRPVGGRGHLHGGRRRPASSYGAPLPRRHGVLGTEIDAATYEGRRWRRPGCTILDWAPLTHGEGRPMSKRDG